MIFYNNALLLQVLLSFSFANGSHILCKAEPPQACKTVCTLEISYSYQSRGECQILYSTFRDWAGSTSGSTTGLNIRFLYS